MSVKLFWSSRISTLSSLNEYQLCWCCHADLALLGPVGLPGEQATVARALQPSHFSAKEGL